MSRNIRTLSIIFSLLLAVGCHNAGDLEWAETVPGRYVGVEKNAKEVLILNHNGEFHHIVYYDKGKLLEESGRWKYDVKSGIIQVAPFTTFYSVDKGRMMASGVVRVSDEFAVYRYGKSATKISQSISFGFCLYKEENP